MEEVKDNATIEESKNEISYEIESKILEVLVDVNEIIEEEIEVINNGNSNKIGVSPFPTATNGGASIDISTYNESLDWNNGDIKEVAVSIDFGNDNTSTGKKLEFVLLMVWNIFKYQ